DERAGAGSETTAQRGRTECEEAENVCSPRAEAIAQHPSREEQDGEGEGVSVDDPLQRGDTRPEVGSDARKRDVDDGDVELDDDESQAGGDQDPAQRTAVAWLVAHARSDRSRRPR